jgi:nuclear pore complex protein Nup160
MYQQGRRLGELNARGGSSFRELATLQCQSYLAATNVLSLVKKEHAWVAVVSGDESERVRLLLPFSVRFAAREGGS